MTRQGFTITLQTVDAGSAIHRGGTRPVRILVLGDFQGRRDQPADIPKLTRDAIVRVDIDNFDQVMSALQPSVTIARDESGEAAGPLNFRSVEDFHPDQLARKDPVLRRLRELKEQLQDSATFSIAVAALGSQADRTSHSGASKGGGERASVRSGGAAETDTETIERLLGARPRTTAPRLTVQAKAVDAMIRRLVAPFTSELTEDAAPYLAAADAAASDRLRRLLHDPTFQALEASWRSLFGLVSQIETGEDLEIALLSLDTAALRHALGNPQEDTCDSDLYHVLSETAATGLDASPWTILVGNYAFGPGEEDVQSLSRIGRACQQLGAYFFAAAKPELLGCPNLLTDPNPKDWTGLSTEAHARWRTLRSSASGQAIALALPRVLLRLPYGRSSDPCDIFSFEELPSPPVHEHFLWGNPAFLCALVLAQAWRDGTDPPRYQDLDDLPTYVYSEGGETRMQPCAEVYLHEAAREAVQMLGCIPVASFQRRNAVRLGPLQTIFGQNENAG